MTPSELRAAAEVETLRAENASIRNELTEATRLYANAIDDAENLRALVDGLRKQAETNHTLRAELAALREELVEYRETIIDSEGIHIITGDKAGWIDSACNSDVCAAAEALVAMGLWEKHPEGYGRRAFYRRKSAAVEGKQA